MLTFWKILQLSLTWAVLRVSEKQKASDPYKVSFSKYLQDVALIHCVKNAPIHLKMMYCIGDLYGNYSGDKWKPIVIL